MRRPFQEPRSHLAVLALAVTASLAAGCSGSPTEPASPTAAATAIPAATANAAAAAAPPSAPMTRIPGGTFQMGADDFLDDQKPIHAATVRPFEMDLTEVTMEAFAACVTAGKCATNEHTTGWHCNWGQSDRLKHPMNCVDHDQATAYCAWVGKRLPTEEEWELAARGTDGRKWPWGNDEPSNQLCWQRNDQGSCAVGSFPAGIFGLFDMAGNVGEWTSSAYCLYSKPGCKDARFVSKSMGWNSFGANGERGSTRFARAAKDARFDVGFRCARDASGEPPPPPPPSPPKQEDAGKMPGANVTARKLNVNGLHLKDLQCHVDGNLGFLGVVVLVIGLGERNPQLAACASGKASETPITWTVSGGKVTSVKAEGADAARNRCVEKALAGAESPQPSVCKATLLLGG